MHLSEMLEHASEYIFLLELALVLMAASLGGAAAKKVHMPPVLGQIVVGIIIGPTVFNMMQGEDELIHIMSQLGVVFLMFLAGLETDLKELKSSGRGAILIAIGGMVVPFLLGSFIPYVFFEHHIPGETDHQKLLGAIYIGTILTATSVSISVSVLRDIKQLTSKQGISILGGAIIDDVLGIIMLAVVSGMVAPVENFSISILLLRMLIFFLGTIVIGFFVSKFITRFAQGSNWRERIITLSIILCFLFAFGAELFNIAAITGAYAAGVMIATTPYRHRVVDKIQTIAYSLFTPIFFVSIGLSATITSDILEYIEYAVIIVVISIVGKMIGCYAGAKLSGFSRKHSLQIGIGMIARAEVALIVANQGYRDKIISNPTFTSIVLLVVISTILTPPLLKLLFKEEPPLVLAELEEENL